MTENIIKEHKLIATYYRVSTARQEENQTIEAQILEVKDFADKKGYTIVEKYEYRDDGWSGDTLVRPGLDQLRLDAKQKMWDTVLIYDPDRLARRSAWQEVVMEELKEIGIDVLFVTVPKAKTDEDIIMYKMRGVFTEYERMKIKERFRLGKVRKVKEGHILTTEALYGYTYIRNVKLPNQPKVHGYYEINEEEARVVKMIFKWVADERMTLRGIVRRLMEMKIRPRKNKDGVWATSTLTTMLRHKAYIGEAHWGKSYAVMAENPYKIEKYRKQKKTGRRDRPEEEWYIIPVPAIIDRDLFDRAHIQLKTNFALCKRNKRNDYLLANKIWCVCGTRRCGCGPQKGKYLYYRCSNRVNSFPLPATCSEKGISAKIADELVWQKTSDLMSSPELMIKQSDKWLNSVQNKPSLSVVDIKELEKEIKKLKEQGERYNKAYGAGLLSIEQLKDYTTPIRERMLVIESQVAKIKEENGQILFLGMPSQEEIRYYAREVSKMIHDLNFEDKREIVLNTIDKVIGNQEKLQVYGRIPVSHVLFRSIHRYRGSSKCW